MNAMLHMLPGQFCVPRRLQCQIYPEFICLWGLCQKLADMESSSQELCCSAQLST